MTAARRHRSAPGAGGETFDEPQEGWIPLAAASRCFIRTPAGTLLHLSNLEKTNWALSSIAALVLRHERVSLQDASKVLNNEMDMEFAGSALVIDGLHGDFEGSFGLFILRLDDDADDFPSGKAILGDTFPDFFDKLKRNRHKELEKAAPIAIRIMSEIQRGLSIGFAEAISAGTATVFARFHDPLEPFRRVAPSQWRFLRVTDEGRGVAETELGAKLFDIHVEPPAVTRAPRVNTTQDVVKEARGWMIRKMLDGPPTMKKDGYRAAAMELFPALTKTAFNERVYPRALEQTNDRRHLDWGKPGPKGPRNSSGHNSSGI